MEQFQLSQAQTAKLTEWEKEPALLDLKNDLENAKPAQQTQVGKITRWNNLLKVENDVKPKKVKGRSSVQPKLIRRQAEWRYSALTEPFLGTGQMFKVEPVTFEDSSAAKQNAKILNYQFRTKLNRVKFIDDYVRSTVDEGTCIVRTGWKRHTIKIKEMVPVYQHYAIQDQESADAFQQALELKTSNPREFNEKLPPEVHEAVKYYEESGQATQAAQTTASANVLVANAARKGATIYNPNAGALLLNLAGGNAATTPHQRLVQYAAYEVGAGYTGLITGALESGTGNANVVEFV